jgi:DNA-binding IclR family transcriptional regulator
MVPFTETASAVQGATRCLRYDPDMGLSVPLSCSAAGHALLSTMSDDEAPTLVARQGVGAGPLVRLTEDRMPALGPALMATAAEVGAASQASAFFKRPAA